MSSAGESLVRRAFEKRSAPEHAQKKEIVFRLLFVLLSAERRHIARAFPSRCAVVQSMRRRVAVLHSTPCLCFDCTHVSVAPS